TVKCLFARSSWTPCHHRYQRCNSFSNSSTTVQEFVSFAFSESRQFAANEPQRFFPFSLLETMAQLQQQQQ
ncbi:unnamed protein product, partial [Ceratitis capitata]